MGARSCCGRRRRRQRCARVALAVRLGDDRARVRRRALVGAGAVTRGDRRAHHGRPLTSSPTRLGSGLFADRPRARAPRPGWPARLAWRFGCSGRARSPGESPCSRSPASRPPRRTGGGLIGDVGALEDYYHRPGHGDPVDHFGCFDAVLLRGDRHRLRDHGRDSGARRGGGRARRAAPGHAAQRRRWLASHLPVAFGGAARCCWPIGPRWAPGWRWLAGDAGQIPRLAARAHLRAGDVDVGRVSPRCRSGCRRGRRPGSGRCSRGRLPRPVRPAPGLPRWLLDLSPFQHVPPLPAAQGSAVPPLLLETAIAGALLAAGGGLHAARDVVGA